MSLLDAVTGTGGLPLENASRSDKKRYSEILSRNLAIEVADGLRSIGFPSVRHFRTGPGEVEFQGGVQPKKVDVSYADERHGLILAVSIKTISNPPFGKNLKNRFGDLFSECVNLHMRFPYSVICGFFAFPSSADIGVKMIGRISTFQRAMKLLASISGRKEHTGPTEKFENVTLMLFEPPSADDPGWVRLNNSETKQEMSETEYFCMLRDTYNERNPHMSIGLDIDLGD